MKTKFFKSVNTRSKKAMIEFLTNHFRYDTMSSWNAATSYANNMKVYKCIPNEYQDKIYKLMECEGFYDDINWLLSDFDESNGHLFQAGFNGRSGGYLVLYIGSVETRTIFTFEGQNKDRDYEDGYGWMDIAEAKKRGLYRKQIRKVISLPGKSIDQHEDFEGWDISELKARVKLVQSFDKLCDNIVKATIEMAKSSKVEEETYTVTKTKKVISTVSPV